MSKIFEGVLTALVTPFKPGATEVDYESWKSLIEWQISTGVHGIVVFGTTGESATLSRDEKLSLAKTAVEISGGRVPIVAGSGSNNTQSSIALTRELAALGVDGALAVTPYYNKPTQEGIFQHYKALSSEGGLPIIVYNIPSRTNLTISTSTFKRLVKLDGIVGVKQASDSLIELLELAKALEDSPLALLAGDDPLVYSVLTVGGKGVISASANVWPDEFVSMIDAARAGEMCKAYGIQQDLLPRIQSLFLETNPAPAKRALKLMGKIECDEVRLPLVPVQETTDRVLKQSLGLEND